MKHFFILNPVAGKGRAEKDLLPSILDAVKKTNVAYEIHRTINVGDATRYVKNRCETNSDTLRFYAVGGDGTLNEVVNGAFGYENAEVAFIPSGTGNDFARVFSNYDFFLNIERQILGNSRFIDLIKYNGQYLINMMNIGLDCDAASMVTQLKKKAFLKGTLAYIAGVAIVFMGNRGINLKVNLDNGQEYQGCFTLVAIGNGAFCGGGFKGVPKARLDDGLLDVSLIKKVNRRTFLSLVGLYHKGKHLDHIKAKDLITYVQCKSLRITHPEGKEIKVCTDGDVKYVDNLDLRILPGTIKFSVPRGCDVGI